MPTHEIKLPFSENTQNKSERRANEYVQALRQIVQDTVRYSQNSIKDRYDEIRQKLRNVLHWASRDPVLKLTGGARFGVAFLEVLKATHRVLVLFECWAQAAVTGEFPADQAIEDRVRSNQNSPEAVIGAIETAVGKIGIAADLERDKDQIAESLSGQLKQIYDSGEANKSPALLTAWATYCINDRLTVQQQRDTTSTLIDKTRTHTESVLDTRFAEAAAHVLTSAGNYGLTHQNIPIKINVAVAQKITALLVDYLRSLSNNSDLSDIEKTQLNAIRRATPDSIANVRENLESAGTSVSFEIGLALDAAEILLDTKNFRSIQNTATLQSIIESNNLPQPSSISRSIFSSSNPTLHFTPHKQALVAALALREQAKMTSPISDLLNVSATPVSKLLEQTPASVTNTSTPPVALEATTTTRPRSYRPHSIRESISGPLDGFIQALRALSQTLLTASATQIPLQLPETPELTSAVNLLLRMLEQQPFQSEDITAAKDAILEKIKTAPIDFADVEELNLFTSRVKTLLTALHGIATTQEEKSPEKVATNMLISSLETVLFGLSACSAIRVLLAEKTAALAGGIVNQISDPVTRMNACETLAQFYADFLALTNPNNVSLPGEDDFATSSISALMTQLRTIWPQAATDALSSRETLKENTVTRFREALQATTSVSKCMDLINSYIKEDGENYATFKMLCAHHHRFMDAISGRKRTRHENDFYEAATGRLLKLCQEDDNFRYCTLHTATIRTTFVSHRVSFPCDIPSINEADTHAKKFQRLEALVLLKPQIDGAPLLQKRLKELAGDAPVQIAKPQSAATTALSAENALDAVKNQVNDLITKWKTTLNPEEESDQEWLTIYNTNFRSAFSSETVVDVTTIISFLTWLQFDNTLETKGLLKSIVGILENIPSPDKVGATELLSRYRARLLESVLPEEPTASEASRPATPQPSSVPGTLFAPDTGSRDNSRSTIPPPPEGANDGAKSVASAAPANTDELPSTSGFAAQLAAALAARKARLGATQAPAAPDASASASANNGGVAANMVAAAAQHVEVGPPGATTPSLVPTS